MSSPRPDAAPIGVFDSGVGGLTVFREINRALPHESLIYLGDSARVPYGTKSPQTVVRYSLEAAHHLMQRGIKLLVVACNTATAAALPALQETLPIPVIGVVEPGARAAIQRTRGRVGVIATEGTVKSHAYRKAIHALDPNVEVIESAAPLFVALAEEGWANTHVAREVAEVYLAPLIDEGIDTLVLGCTHYPILRDVISETVGREVKLIDSGAATARDVESLLESSDLTHEDAPGLYQERQLCDDLDHFYVTDAAERFAKVAERFLGSAPSILEAVEIWGHDELRTH